MDMTWIEIKHDEDGNWSNAPEPDKEYIFCDTYGDVFIEELMHDCEGFYLEMNDIQKAVAYMDVPEPFKKEETNKYLICDFCQKPIIGDESYITISNLFELKLCKTCNRFACFSALMVGNKIDTAKLKQVFPNVKMLDEG